MLSNLNASSCINLHDSTKMYNENPAPYAILLKMAHFLGIPKTLLPTLSIYD